MNWHPHVTVATVVFSHGKYLMVLEESNGKGVYNQPAGHLEQNETLAQAALRETFEETRWHVELTGFLGVSEFTSLLNGTTYIRNTFLAIPTHEDVTATLDPDITEAMWLDYDEILQRKDNLRSPLVINDIKRHRQKQIFPLDMVFADTAPQVREPEKPGQTKRIRKIRS